MRVEIDDRQIGELPERAFRHWTSPEEGQENDFVVTLSEARWQAMGEPTALEVTLEPVT